MNKDFGEELMSFHFEIDGDNFTSAGQASMSVKKSLGQLGIAPDIIRKVSIAMYEGEINMVIHAEGGTADVIIYNNAVKIFLQDAGPGIDDVEKAMQEGFSTAPDTIRSLGFGAGMGLPNMRKYTDDMLVESTVGVGTTVTMIVNY
jgi:anti-sigma regulatory factor (Ser/Thr protein kinase)